MTIIELDKKLKAGEGTRIEFKEAQKGVPTTLYETVASFSNTEGGTIVLGADDTGKVLGIDASLLNGYKSDIITSLSSLECINPTLLLSPAEIAHPDGNVIVLQVPASSQVHTYKKRVYWRDADADLDVTDNQHKVGEIYLQKRQLFSEAKIYKYLTYEDLEPKLFDKARSLIRGFSSLHPWVSASDEQILKESSLYRKDYTTGEEGLTLAAALIFGKNTTIQNLLPAYKVEAMVRRVNADRYDDRITLRINLIDTYLELMDFIKKHLNEQFFTEDGQRKDLRELIFREVIGNLVVHREYTDARSSEVLVYQDRVLTTNPNRPLFHGPLEPFNFSPYPKNPNIRKFFTAFGWTDEIGSGVRNTHKYLSIYVPGATPLFYENNVFRTEIPLAVVTLQPYTEELVSWLQLSAEAVAHVAEGLYHVQLNPQWKGNSWEDLLLKLVPSWYTFGTKLVALKWPLKQQTDAKDIQMVPSWQQDGTKVLGKRVRYLLAIGILTATPAKLEELMHWIGYSNRASFRENYLNPMQQEGLVEKTNPDNPNDPEQRYRLTQKGALFIAGKII
ncbi:AlbA family DNA-binding domain-containing protein [Pontibacter roseus]|uniref:AlbA family DNA-binding domain-containing protein n=1 Tax=Pontibacter roseus TaxID=336989 RepID=UPI00036A27CC|nr:RNA-binding domain-containing protein [Pontibacter roseus]